VSEALSLGLNKTGVPSFILLALPKGDCHELQQRESKKYRPSGSTKRPIISEALKNLNAERAYILFHSADKVRAARASTDRSPKFYSLSTAKGRLS